MHTNMIREQLIIYLKVNNKYRISTVQGMKEIIISHIDNP